jgi:plastocyanin
MRSPLAAVLAAALLAAAPAAAVLAAAPSGPTVTIDNFTFGPNTLTVKAGTTVTWVNHDDIPHAVVSDDHAAFRSKVLDTDQAFSFTFAKAGVFPYFCSLHPHMTGKVVVQ